MKKIFICAMVYGLMLGVLGRLSASNYDSVLCSLIDQDSFENADTVNFDMKLKIKNRSKIECNGIQYGNVVEMAAHLKKYNALSWLLQCPAQGMAGITDKKYLSTVGFNTPLYDGAPMLYWTSVAGQNWTTTLMLCDQGADPNFVWKGKTILHWAIEKIARKIKENKISEEPRLDPFDDYFKNFINPLLTAKADPNLKTSDGKTAFDLAAEIELPRRVSEKPYELLVQLINKTQVPISDEARKNIVVKWIESDDKDLKESIFKSTDPEQYLKNNAQYFLNIITKNYSKRKPLELLKLLARLISGKEVNLSSNSRLLRELLMRLIEKTEVPISDDTVKNVIEAGIECDDYHLIESLVSEKKLEKYLQNNAQSFLDSAIKSYFKNSSSSSLRKLVAHLLSGAEGPISDETIKNVVEQGVKSADKYLIESLVSEKKLDKYLKNNAQRFLDDAIKNYSAKHSNDFYFIMKKFIDLGAVLHDWVADVDEFDRLVKGGYPEEFKLVSDSLKKSEHCKKNAQSMLEKVLDHIASSRDHIIVAQDLIDCGATLKNWVPKRWDIDIDFIKFLQANKFDFSKKASLSQDFYPKGLPIPFVTGLVAKLLDWITPKNMQMFNYVIENKLVDINEKHDGKTVLEYFCDVYAKKTAKALQMYHFDDYTFPEVYAVLREAGATCDSSYEKLLQELDKKFLPSSEVALKNLATSLHAIAMGG